MDLNTSEKGFIKLINKYKPEILGSERRGVGKKVRERLAVFEDGKLQPRVGAYHNIAALIRGEIIFECAHRDFVLGPDDLEMLTPPPPTPPPPTTPPPTPRRTPSVCMTK